MKCPYKYHNVNPCTVTKPSFYMMRSDDGCLQLSRNHAYYHQIQGQLAICEKEYCDFICWMPPGIYTEQIVLEPSYLNNTKPSLDAFFIKIILPLLLMVFILAGKSSQSAKCSHKCNLPVLFNLVQQPVVLQLALLILILKLTVDVEVKRVVI